MCIIIRKNNLMNTGSETWWTRSLTCQAESSLMRRHSWLRSHVSHRPMRQWLSRYILFYKQNISVLLGWPFSLPISSNRAYVNFLLIANECDNVDASTTREPAERKGFPHMLSRDFVTFSRSHDYFPRLFLLGVWTEIDLCVLSILIIFIANTQISSIQARKPA